jgi:hemoglobin/transferrin/lactoferrin receptor protein
LRGLTGQRVLVLMDGSPMNSARGNGPHPSLVDPEQVERIEVVRGPSSVAYGSDALGGVINIITREALFTAPDQRFRGSATVSGSTADAQRNGSLEAMTRVGKLSAFLSGGGRKTEDFHAPHEQVPNSAFSDWNGLANLRYDLTPHVTLKGGYQLYRADKVGIPGLTLDEPGAQQEFDFKFYDRDAAHLTLEHQHPQAWLGTGRVKFYWQREHRNFFSDQTLDASQFNTFGIPPRAGAASATTLQDRFFDLNTYGFQAQFTSIKTRYYRMSAGVDGARDVTAGDNVRLRSYADASGAPVGSASTRVTSSVPEGNFDNYGAFSQTEWYLHPQWTLSAGGRLSYYHFRTEGGLSQPGFYFEPRKVDDNALSGSVGLVYSPVQDLHLSFNVANGYRHPNAQDLYFDGPASGGIYVVGNPDLQPETSVSYDLGLRWGPGGLAFSGNLFYSTYTDLIDAVAITPPPQAFGQPTYQYTNIASARIYGAEAEAQWHLREQWDLRSSASTSVGEVTDREAIRTLYGQDADRAPLANVPPFKGSLGLRWTDARGRLWVEPSARYSWRTNRLPLPIPNVPEPTEFKKEWIAGDVMAGARFPTGQRLVVGVRNLTNTPYRQALSSVVEPGINVVASLSTDF